MPFHEGEEYMTIELKTVSREVSTFISRREVPKMRTIRKDFDSRANDHFKVRSFDRRGLCFHIKESHENLADSLHEAPN